MILPLTLARIVVAVALFVLPFILFIWSSGKQENAMILIFPFFGAIPAIVGALVLFLPVELFLDSRGLGGWKNLVIPVVGFILPIIFAIVMGTVWGSLDTLVRNLGNGGWGAWIVWGVFGAFWGFVWRATEWLAKLIGIANG